MSEDILLRDDQGHRSTLTLNRPRQFNSLSSEMLGELQRQLDDIAQNPDIHLVVLAGNGKAFCAGHDLKEMRSHSDEAWFKALFDQCTAVMMTIRDMPQPVIARVHGMATAAGCQLVATCDLAVAVDSARFAVSGINVGLFCSTPAVALSRNLGRKRAFEMLITGEFIDAPTAADWGLINHAVAQEALDDAVDKLCSAILAKSQVAVRTGKSMYYRQLETDMASAYELAGSKMAANMMSTDVGEGIDAFVEKRKPAWQHQ